jgi:hypothetical protein
MRGYSIALMLMLMLTLMLTLKRILDCGQLLGEDSAAAVGVENAARSLAPSVTVFFTTIRRHSA